MRFQKTGFALFFLSIFLQPLCVSEHSVELNARKHAEIKHSAIMGSTIDGFVLYCYVYNADSKNYSPVAAHIMKVAGYISLAALVIFLSFLWFGNKFWKNKDKE